MTRAKQITVLLAEDHRVVRQGLRTLLTVEGNFKIVGEAQNGREAVQLARTLRPDVIVMDIAMPILNGLEATRQILAANPTDKVLILSAHSDDVYVARMQKAGVAGFLEKQTSAEILCQAIEEVAQGHTFISPAIEKRLQAAVSRSRHRGEFHKESSPRLTPREREVLQLVAEGSANKQTAAQLEISTKTVEKHRQHLMDKLQIHDTAGLTRYAIAHGIIEGGVHLTII